MTVDQRNRQYITATAIYALIYNVGKETTFQMLFFKRKCICRGCAIIPTIKKKILIEKKEQTSKIRVRVRSKF